MSFDILLETWDEANLPSGELFLLLALAEKANKHGKAWPSVATLAERTRQRKTTVRRQLRRLELLGFIKTEPGKAPRGDGNLYTMLFPWRKLPGWTPVEKGEQNARGCTSVQRAKCSPGGSRMLANPVIDPVIKNARAREDAEALKKGINLIPDRDGAMYRDMVAELEKTKNGTASHG